MELMTDHLWFSPINVLHHFARLDAILPVESKRSREYKKAREAYVVAKMLVGIIAHQKTEYWMQIANDREGSPDIRTLKFIGESNDGLMQHVEHTTYNEFSTDDIVSFLQRTKLPPVKIYPDKTTILCEIDKTGRLGDLRELHEKFMSICSADLSIIIMGRLHPQREIYRICQIYPDIDLLHDYDLEEECKNKKYVGVRRISRGRGGMLSGIYLPDEKHYPFESLGFTS